MSNGKRPLEWVAGSPGVVAGGASTEEENNRLSLGLRDDEVAEIHKIVVTTQLRDEFGNARLTTLSSWVSMDPNTVYSNNLFEDLETIVFKTRSARSKGILVGVEEVIKEDEEVQYDYNPPVLVGTDLGIGIYLSCSHGNADAGTTAQIRVYFTRRKANVAELNQILLKRR